MTRLREAVRCIVDVAILLGLALVVLIQLALIVFVLVYAALTPSKAHDIYNGLHEGLDPAAKLCCGGDPVTGDCEAVEYKVFANGDALIFSKRYQRSVMIARDKITWLAIPGGEAFEAHWCGKPIEKMGYPPSPDPEQIDPQTYTYCAFIRPGGV